MTQHMQSTTGGQMQQTGGQMTEGMQTGQGMRLRDVETPQQREMMQQIQWAAEICGFCAEQCIAKGDPHMAECIRLCEDVTELAETAMAMVPRQSRFAHSMLQVLQQAMQACASECAQHSDAHCQDCAQTLPQATDAIQQHLATMQGGQMGQQSQPMQGAMQSMR